MRKLKINLNFEDDAMLNKDEIARILESYAYNLRSGCEYRADHLMDINGNTVGYAQIVVE